MKLKPQTAIFASIVIAVIGIVLSMVLGLWNTESTKVPRRLQQIENTTGQGSGTNQGAGQNQSTSPKPGDSQSQVQYDPMDIRGSYKFSEISDLFKIPVSDLASAFYIKENAESFACKDLEKIYADAPNEIGTGSVKLFVALYVNVPVDLTEETYLPEAAVQILKAKGTLSAEQIAYLEKHTVKLP